ncbi:MAG: ABC transporter substrate-binding protein [Betaproteobacteria bacterium]|nr:MAG: ABC transporter substrate-binding protein [Betaproteobacteria bacterium]
MAFADRRRRLIALGLAALAAPRFAVAQKVWRIGVLETIARVPNAANFEAFIKGMRDVGYVETKNLLVDYRSGDGQAERFAALADELVRAKVDLILTRGTPAALTAAKATRTIPIVMAAIGEPLGRGIVASLAHPGGNVTGLSSFVTELTGKRLEVLQALRKMSRVATLLNMSNPIFAAQWKETQLAGEKLGIQAQLLDVRKAEDLEAAFAAAVQQRADGLIVGIDAVTQASRTLIAQLAARHRLPAVYAAKEFADAGGLLSYGVSYPDLYHRAAGFVHKIFGGARPGDLPVEQPTKYELVINGKAAAALGLAIPASLLARADEIIQ